MGHRTLFSVILAVAMLFAPVAVFSGAAMAMAPAAMHQADATESGHCDDQPTPASQNMSDEQPCCAAMCAAIAVAHTGPALPSAETGSPDRPTLPSANHSFLVKLPTPPPRLD